MTKSELYLWISAVLFVVGMAIIPVGGFTESNVYHDYYFYGFLSLEINMIVSIVVLLINTRKNQV